MPAEITDKNITRDDINKAWPSGVLYKGKSMFDPYVNDWTSEIHAYFENASGQECFLAYLPNSDEFLMAFDMSDTEEEVRDALAYDNENEYYIEECEGGPNVAQFKVGDDMNVIFDSIKTVDGCFGMFYSSGNGYVTVKKNFPNRIDLRLD